VLDYDKEFKVLNINFAPVKTMISQLQYYKKTLKKIHLQRLPVYDIHNLGSHINTSFCLQNNQIHRNVLCVVIVV